jgi:hypothetical protein
MDIRTWNEKKFSYDEILQMWFEYYFVKDMLGEIDHSGKGKKK